MNSTFSRLELCCSEELIRWRGRLLPSEDKPHWTKLVRVSVITRSRKMDERWALEAVWTMFCWETLGSAVHVDFPLMHTFYLSMFSSVRFTGSYRVCRSSQVWLCAGMRWRSGRSSASSLQLPADRHWRTKWSSPGPPAGSAPTAPGHTTNTYWSHMDSTYSPTWPDQRETNKPLWLQTWSEGR